MFRGSIVALVTPFSGGVVDLPRLAELVEAQIAGGTSALVPCGTTGEAATLDRDEREAVLREVIRRAQAAGPGRAGRPIPVIAGTGTNNTRSTIEFTHAARQLGADAALIVCPYYNKPTQEGLFRHYAAVSEAVDLPIIAYNVPGRTAVSLTADTVSRIAALKNVVAIKEASGNLDLVSEIRLGSKITVLSGDDSLTLPILALGGTGVISVVANVVPADVAGLVAAWERGEVARARELHFKLYPLARAMFVESNPAPAKAALAMLGRMSDEVRLPLAPLSADARAKVEKALRAYGLL